MKMSRFFCSKEYLKFLLHAFIFLNYSHKRYPQLSILAIAQGKIYDHKSQCEERITPQKGSLE